jgi:SAM-dependent methyltransferase
LLGDIAGLEVLELGAGAGFYTRELTRRGARQVWAVDISSAMLAALPAGRITPVLGDAAMIRLDRRFPVPLSTGMLEFVADPAAMLANAAHHAEASARFVILVPQHSGAALPGISSQPRHRYSFVRSEVVCNLCAAVRLAGPCNRFRGAVLLAVRLQRV